VGAVEGEPSTVDASRRESASPGWMRLLPLGLVAAACIFNLVVLRSETTPAHNLNDSAFHLQMVQWADGQIGNGRVPLDGWFPNLTLGSSFFHHYQSLPYTLTAYAARVTGLSDVTTYLWIQYLLLALWPISVYAGARLLGMNKWTAASAALLSPLVVSASGYGYEHGSYTWRGYGLYTQLFGMMLLPITWGLTWRAVSKGERWFALAALSLALTIATHLMTGYLAVLMVGVWALLSWSGILRRFARAAIVVAGGLLTAAWVLVPLLADRNYAAESSFYTGTIFNDSYGAGKILGWLFSGELYDSKRIPILTILLAIGFVVCVLRARTNETARALLAAWTFSLILFFGRATWGWATDALPGNRDLQMHRFIIGVHLAGILIAGVGLVTVARFVAAIVPLLAKRIAGVRARTVVVWFAVALLLFGVLVPAWRERAGYDLADAPMIASQRAAERSDGADFARLVDEATARGGGRIYAGTRANWGKDYTIGAVPAFAELSNANVDAIGFTFRTVQSLSTDIEASFDEANPAQYQALDVKYIILPNTREPSVPAQLLDAAGRHRLYEVDTTGYFQVVDVIGSVTADRADLGDATARFRNSDGASRNVYPSVAFDGAAAAPPTVAGSEPPAGAPGKVLDTTIHADDGSFTATVDAARPAMVLLKETYDPRWHVTVDGAAAKPVMLAPSLVGVNVPAGRHVVAFQYRSYQYYPVLFAIGLLTLLGLAIWPFRDRYFASFTSTTKTSVSSGAISGGEPDAP
jgi:hypothetical protein